MSNTIAAELLESLQDAGLPVHGVSVAANGAVSPKFLPGASAKDLTDAAAIIAAFDKSPRKPKPVDTVKSDVAKLTEEQFVAVLRRMTAEYLLAHPEAAKEVGIAVEEKI